ncbi:MAG TPA: thiamine biosynthesis protein ThiS [bacterium]|nr:thiamine biosynthesis protein ThiS [bacterium]
MKVKFRSEFFSWPEEKMKGREIIRRVGLSAEAALLVRNGELATEEDWFKSEDEIEVYTAISGG